MLAIILMFTLFVSSAFSVTVNSANVPDVDLLITEIDELIQNYQGTTVKSFYPLYSASEEIIAYAFCLAPKGYAVVDITGVIVEYSLQNNFPTTFEQKIYYGGPRAFFVKHENQYVNVLSSYLITDLELLQMNQKYTDNTEKVQEQESTQEQNVSRTSIIPHAATTTVNIPGTTRKYSYNPNGICGSTAAAILLMYYYDYVDSYMVPSWHVTDTGESLIKLIEPYLDGSEPGSNTADAVSGLNWYFRWRGISSKYTAVSQSPATFSKYGQIIRSNRPVLIDLDAHPTYNEHWVVGYGYIIRGSAYYADVNDGWGSTGIIINMSYVGDIVYIVE